MLTHIKLGDVAPGRPVIIEVNWTAGFGRNAYVRADALDGRTFRVWCPDLKVAVQSARAWMRAGTTLKALRRVDVCHANSRILAGWDWTGSEWSRSL